MKKIIYLSLAGVAIAVFLISPFLIKVNVLCKSQFGDCPPYLTNKFQGLNGKSIFAAKKDISKILKGDYLISDYSTQFKLSDTLLVNVLIKKPEFALSNTDSSKILLVDFDGTVLTQTDSTTLPKVISITNLPNPGEKVDDPTLISLKIIQGVWSMYQINTARMDNDGLVVDLPGKINVIFPVTEDPEISLGALRLIYTKITTGDSAGLYSQIDLRFKNPVLR